MCLKNYFIILLRELVLIIILVLNKIKPTFFGIINAGALGHFIVEFNYFQLYDYDSSKLYFFIIGSKEISKDKIVSNKFIHEKMKKCNKKNIIFLDNRIFTNKIFWEFYYNQNSTILKKTRKAIKFMLEPGGHKYRQFDPCNKVEKQSLETLRFTSREYIEGYKSMDELGLEPNQKYICLNVRNNTYYKSYNIIGHELKNLRNANLSNYELAIDFFLSKGTKVVLVGDYTEINLDNKISKHPFFINYSKSKIRNDFLDIFLISHSSLLFGTATGLFEASLYHNKSVLMGLSDCASLHQYCGYRKNAYIYPKNFIFKKTNLRLKPIDYFVHVKIFEEMKINNFLEYSDNDSNQLLEFSKEMWERMNNTYIESVDIRNYENKTIFSINNYLQSDTFTFPELKIDKNPLFLSRFSHSYIQNLL